MHPKFARNRTPSIQARSIVPLRDNGASLRRWVTAFVAWYNAEHRHSGIRFVTPDQRHDGRENDVLANRVRVYERARRSHPNRWSRGTRNWTPAPAVFLNPKRDQETIEGALSRATS